MEVVAVHLGKKIQLKELQLSLGLKPSLKDPLTFEYSSDKFVVILKYGVCVFWGFNQGEINEFKTKVSPYITDKFVDSPEEHTEINISGKDEIKLDDINIKELNVERIGIISLVLSRSIALDYYDLEVEKALTENEEIMRSFMEKGRTNMSSKNLIKKIGFAMSIRHQTVTQMAFLDKPDLTWEDESLDRLYNKLAEYYELTDRYEVLDDKLETIFRNVEFISDYITARRPLAAEIIIILLIAFDLMIFFAGKLFS
jgi:uncharacterized Rmd1/YagE family protein